MAAQVVFRLPGNNKCPSHTGQKLSVYCINCDTLVCVRCVTSRIHRGHEFEELSEHTNREIEKLQQILDTNENTDLVQIKKDVSNIKEEMAKIQVKSNNMSALIKSRVREIKEEADKQAEILLSDCEKNEAENCDILLGYQAELEKQQRNCEEQIDMLKRTLQSGNEIEVFDTRHNTKTFVLGSAPLQLATYQPSTSVREVVSMALGSLVLPVKQSQEHNPTAERWQRWPKTQRLPAAAAAGRPVSGGKEQRKQRPRPPRNDSQKKVLKNVAIEVNRLTDLMQKDLASSDEDSDTGAMFRAQRRGRSPRRHSSDDDLNDELAEIVRRHWNCN